MSSSVSEKLVSPSVRFLVQSTVERAAVVVLVMEPDDQRERVLRELGGGTGLYTRNRWAKTSDLFQNLARRLDLDYLVEPKTIRARIAEALTKRFRMLVIDDADRIPPRVMRSLMKFQRAANIPCLMGGAREGFLNLVLPTRAGNIRQRRLAEPTPRTVMPTNEEVRAWTAQFAGGMTPANIARDAKRSESTIRRYLASAGCTLIDRRGRTGPSAKRKEVDRWYRAYVEEKRSLHEIALEAGRADKTVMRALKRRGVEIRGPGKRLGFHFRNQASGHQHVVEVKPEDVVEWAERYTAGEPFERISAEVGIHRTTVMHRVRRYLDEVRDPGAVGVPPVAQGRHAEAEQRRRAIGDGIKRFRHETQISVVELARRAGVNPLTVYRLEWGKRPPRELTLRRLLAVIREIDPETVDRMAPLLNPSE